MNPLTPFLLRQLSCILFASLALVYAAQAQEPKPGITQWPNVSVEIFSIERFADNRVSARFLFSLSSSAKTPAWIAHQFIMPNETPEAIEAFGEVWPYSLAGATLIEEGTAKSFPLSIRRSGETRPGRSVIKLELPPGGSFLIGQIFECPPVNMDDPPKKQFVSFQLPGLKSLITGVPLPREINKPQQFSREKVDKPSRP